MAEPASDKTWALANGCSGQLTSTAVRATYRSPRPSGKPLTVETTAVHHVWGGCPAEAAVAPTKPEEGSDLNLAIQAIVCGIALLVVCGIMFACVCATR